MWLISYTALWVDSLTRSGDDKLLPELWQVISGGPPVNPPLA